MLRAQKRTGQVDRDDIGPLLGERLVDLVVVGTRRRLVVEADALAVALVGAPVMLAEFVIGRRTQRNPVGAFKALAPRTAWVPTSPGRSH